MRNNAEACKPAGRRRTPGAETNWVDRSLICSAGRKTNTGVTSRGYQGRSFTSFTELGKKNRLIRQVCLKPSRDVDGGSVRLNTAELLRGKKTHTAKQYTLKEASAWPPAALTHIVNTHPRQNPIAQAAVSKLQQDSEKLSPAGEAF